MNPLLVEALGSVVRAVLNIGAGWLVARGIWTSEKAETYVAAGALALIAYGWSVWQKQHMRAKLVTSNALAGVTEREVHAMVKDPDVATPSVGTPKDMVPTIEKK